jgi:hypothetical protein
MNRRSAGSKSSTGISLEGEAGLEAGGVSGDPVFLSCAAAVVTRRQRAARQLKLIRDNVNSPLSLNGLKPGFHERS